MRHQVDVVLVPVDPKVEDVERPHRGPAVLVREGDRGEAVLLHLLGQRYQVVHRLGDGVAVGCPDGLAVEERPRVVAGGHEVLLAVVARRCGLEPVGEPGEVRPHVADVAGQALGGEEAHAVAGEPGEDVIGLALQVVVDVLLERVVVHRVDLHGVPGRRIEAIGLSLQRCARDLVRLVRAERDGLVDAAGAGAAAGAAAARREHARQAQGRAGAHDAFEYGAAREAGIGDGLGDQAREVLGLGLGTGHCSLLGADEQPTKRKQRARL